MFLDWFKKPEPHFPAYTEDVTIYVRNNEPITVDESIDLSMMLAQLPHRNGWLYDIPEPCITKNQYERLPPNLQKLFKAKEITIQPRKHESSLTIRLGSAKRS